MAQGTLIIITWSCVSNFTKSNTCFLGIRKNNLKVNDKSEENINHREGNGLIVTVSKDINKKMDKRLCLGNS